mgnify:CR=1 FL=1
MPDIRNINIGPAWAYFGAQGSEVNLGWTQGGITLKVDTSTTDIEVDQESEPVMSNITSRLVSVTVPLAEYTLEAMAVALPGATLYTNAATLTTNLEGENNDLVFTAKTGGGIIGPGNDITVEYLNPGAITAACAVSVSGRAISVTLKHDGSEITATANEVLAAIEGSDDAKAIVTVAKAGSDTGATAVTAMAETALTGGKQKLVVKSAANQDMTSFAKSLILHPTNKNAGDKSMDVWFPKAAPIGSLEVTYDKENPKLISVEFKTFPDTDGKTFVLGDPTTTEA